MNKFSQGYGQMRILLNSVFFIMLILALNPPVLCQIIPPSPASAEVAKYVTYPVSIENGLPDIRIPLYEIKVGKISIPIELKYHASGIRYGQSNGEVGVGWMLNPTYRVSRTVFGRPDELYDKPFSDINLPNFGSSKERDQYLSNFFPRQSTLGLPSTPAPVDGEFDMFNYAIPEGGGGFIMTDRVNNTLVPVSLDSRQLSFGRVAGKKDIDYFDVRDGKGGLFRFGKSLDGQKRYEEQDQQTSQVKTAWMLTDIEDGLGAYMRLNYSKGYEGQVREEAAFTVVQGGEGQWGSSFDQIRYPTSVNLFHHPVTTRLSEVQRLSTVETRDEKILFFHRPGGLYLLDSIRIEAKNGGVLRRISFTYTSGMAHTSLSSVALQDASGTNINVWSFSYKDQPGLGFQNFVPDYWGYYKRVYSPAFPERFPDFGTVEYYEATEAPGMVAYLPRDTRDKGLRGTDRNADVVPDYFMLQSIRFPTGGTAEYQYEANRYMGIFGSKIAGVRIASVSLDDGSGNKMQRRYTYGVNGDGLGNVTADMASNDYYIREVPYFDSGSGTYVKSYTRTTYSSHNTSEVMLLAGGSAPVRYRQVTEYEGMGSLNGGKTVYDYNLNPADWDWNTFLVNSQFPSSSYNWSGNARYPQYFVNHDYSKGTPTLKRKTVYGFRNGGYIPLQKEEFDYAAISTGAVRGLKVRSFAESAVQYVGREDQFYATGLHSLFDYAVYRVEAGGQQATGRRLVDYNGADSVVRQESYRYNPLFQLSNRESLSSENERTGAVMSYVGDFTDASGTLAELRSGNRLLPVEEVNYRYQGTIPYITGGNIYRYHVGGKGLLSQQYELMGAAALSLSTFKFGNTVLGKFPWEGTRSAFAQDSRYQLKIAFNSYDSYGNPTEVTNLSGKKDAYLWGYNGQYPVAEIRNASYADVLTALGGGTVATGKLNTLNGSVVTDAAVNGITAPLRTALPKAQITSFTYKSLVGMTSRTDPGGRTETYEYDGMGRLAAIRNHEGNIIKTFCYALNGQLTDCGKQMGTAQTHGVTVKLKSKIGLNAAQITVSEPSRQVGGFIELGESISMAFPKNTTDVISFYIPGRMFHDADVKLSFWVDLGASGASGTNSFRLEPGGRSWSMAESGVTGGSSRYIEIPLKDLNLQYGEDYVITVE